MNEIPPVVLVVDDEIQIRRFLRTGFELNGFAVTEAETGAEAMRATTLKPIDLVILDLGLPDMDGAEVVERIRSWSSVPIIVLSVRATEAKRSICSSSAPTTTWSSRSAWPSFWRASVRDATADARGARRADGQVRPAHHRFCRPRGVRSTSSRLTLTPKEYRLLQVLAQHAGNVVTHQHSCSRRYGATIHVARHALSAYFRAQAAAEDRAAPDPAAYPGDRIWRRLSAGLRRRPGRT